MATTHTTLLEILSQPVTGDASGIQATGDKVVHDKLLDTKKQALGSPQTMIDDSTATPEDIKAGERIYHEALAYIKDAIAPAMVKVSPHDIQINDTFCKTLFTYAYPDFLE